MHQRERKPKDRDFIQTKEGMFFCVTGYLHPPGKYTAYLKYSPSWKGKWRDKETTYRRELDYYHVSNVAKTIQYLGRNYPHYVHYYSAWDIKFSIVPQEYVKRYYLPEERLSEIFITTRDTLEEEVYDFASEIIAHTGITEGDLGITGSILLDIHDPQFSDIDLLVYGLENAFKVRAMIKRGKSDRIHNVTGKALQDWCTTVAKHFPLTSDEAEYFASRRWNYGFFRNRYFSIHPTRKDAEIKERYLDNIYKDKGEATIRATVSDARESLFMPAVYRIEDVEDIKGGAEVQLAAPELREVISYEGLYRDIVDSGEKIEAKGKLESVNGTYYRLLIGTTKLKGKGYIKPARS